MGTLDEAIREHLDLKRRRGADPAEVARQERDALGSVRRDAGPDATAAPPDTDELDAAGERAGDAADEATRVLTPEDRDVVGEPTQMLAPEELPAADAPAEGGLDQPTQAMSADDLAEAGRPAPFDLERDAGLGDKPPPRPPIAGDEPSPRPPVADDPTGPRPPVIPDELGGRSSSGADEPAPRPPGVPDEPAAIPSPPDERSPDPEPSGPVAPFDIERDAGLADEPTQEHAALDEQDTVDRPATSRPDSDLPPAARRRSPPPRDRGD